MNVASLVYFYLTLLPSTSIIRAMRLQKDQHLAQDYDCMYDAGHDEDVDNDLMNFQYDSDDTVESAGPPSPPRALRPRPPPRPSTIRRGNPSAVSEPSDHDSPAKSTRSRKSNRKVRSPADTDTSWGDDDYDRGLGLLAKAASTEESSVGTL